MLECCELLGFTIRFMFGCETNSDAVEKLPLSGRSQEEEEEDRRARYDRGIRSMLSRLFLVHFLILRRGRVRPAPGAVDSESVGGGAGCRLGAGSGGRLEEGDTASTGGRPACESEDIQSFMFGSRHTLGHPQGCLGRGGGTPHPPIGSHRLGIGAQPMPSHCPPDAKCQAQRHL